MTKVLLTVMGLVETATGAALLAAPSAVATLLLGATLDTPAAQVVGRVAGAALLALGVICGRGRAVPIVGRSACFGMLVYNAAGAVLLAYAGAHLRLQAVLLWPAVFLHAVLAAWCVASLRPRWGGG